MSVAKTLLSNSTTPNEFLINRYLRFINRYQTVELSGYYERHHIIPRSFGGSNDKENIVRLPARAHYIAHLILAKATSNPKMIKALHKMVYSKGPNRDYKITSKVYEFIRAKHAVIVSNYSKGTVVAKQTCTGEVKRIPLDLFHKYNGILYESLVKGRKCSEAEIQKKRASSKRPRTVKLGQRSRKLAATRYSYVTPKGFCEIREELFKLYPSFTANTLTVIDNDVIISKKFASCHKEFLPYVGKTFAEYGIKRIDNVKNKSK